MDIGTRIKDLRSEKNLTQTKLGEVIGVEKSTVSMYENGNSTPNDDIKKMLANFFNVSLDYLIGVSDIRNPYKESETSSEKNSSLTTKDERDIAKKLSSILDEMSNSSDALMFDGERIEMDEESQELLRASIENSLRLAKRLAKEKYTPKKYRE